MLCSISRLAEMTGFARDTIAGRLKDADIDPDPGSSSNLKLYEPRVVLPVLYNAQGSGQAELSRERARLARAQAERVEAENLVRRRALLEAGELETTLGGAFKVLAQALSVWPDQVEMECGLSGELVARLHRLVDSVRENLYQALIEFCDREQEKQAE